MALVLKGFLKPEWTEAAYRNAGGSGRAPSLTRTEIPKATPLPSGIVMACTRPRIRTTACPWACAGAFGPEGPKPACRSIAWSATAARSAARATSGWETPSST